MKLEKLLFWRRNRRRREKSQKRQSEKIDEEVSAKSTTDVECRPRSSSFSGVEDIKEKKKSKKVKRSSSVGHKTTRRNSFIRWYKRSKEVGKALRKIGDDLESIHSNSELSLTEKLKK